MLGRGKAPLRNLSLASDEKTTWCHPVRSCTSFWKGMGEGWGRG